jgi:hypothetical protein
LRKIGAILIVFKDTKIARLDFWADLLDQVKNNWP